MYGAKYVTFTQATDGKVVPAPAIVTGVSTGGLTITVHDGSSSAGPIVLHSVSAPFSMPDPGVECKTGVFVVVTGTGTGTIWFV